MSGVRELLERPMVEMSMGAIILLFAVVALAGGGIFVGLLLGVAGGRSAWRGFSKWQAERS